MPAGPTYTPIASVTLTSGTTSIIFDNIPQSYTDLVIIFRMAIADGYVLARFNGDSGSNYSRTNMYYNTSVVGSGTGLNETASYPECNVNTVGNSITIWDLLNYSSSTTMKTGITEYQNQPGATAMYVNSYRSTTPITSIAFTSPSSNNILTGSTIDIYGIARA
jgi:hypothetical protein